jgi:hypothetical protein
MILLFGEFTSHVIAIEKANRDKIKLTEALLKAEETVNKIHPPYFQNPDEANELKSHMINSITSLKEGHVDPELAASEFVGALSMLHRIY